MAEKLIAKALEQEADADAVAVNAYITTMAPKESTFDDAVADAAVTYLIAEAEAADTWMAAQQQANVDYLGRAAGHSGNWADQLAYHIALAQQTGANYARPLLLALDEAMFAAEGAAVHEIDPAQLAYENAVGAAGLAATQAHDSAWVTAEDEFVDDQLADEEAVLSAAEAEDGAMISATVSWLTSVASAAKTAADANADAAMAMVIAIAGQTESVADTITQDAVTELEADNAANVAQVAADGAAIESYIASQPAGAPIFQLAAQSTTPQWHHLLPQEFRDQFTKIGINIDDARWGWILKPGDHADVHNEWWNTEWENFFKDNKSPTMKDVEQKLKGLFDTDEFLTIYKNGAKATMPFGDWKALTPSQKSSTFKNLLKATAFLGAVLGVLGAASDAQGALGPVLLLGDPVAQGEYQAALTALQEGRYQDAEQALFGSAEHDLSTIQSSNPNGLIPKMLSRMNDANPQSAPALWQLYLRARAKFSDLVRGANSGI